MKGDESAEPIDNNIVNDMDSILSQDFFCTPDYITPNCQSIPNNLDCNMLEEIPCPKSPEKQRTCKGKRPRMDSRTHGFFDVPDSPCDEEVTELAEDSFEIAEISAENLTGTKSQKVRRYVPHSAVALRCRVMPLPCATNVFARNAKEHNVNPPEDQRSKTAGYIARIIGGDNLARYRHDFHEIEQIGRGNFSCVFKAVHRLDGIVYAVKKSTRQLTRDMERRHALMEVHALAAMGRHDHLVNYHSAWFEEDRLYIQLELCDRSLSVGALTKLYTQGDVLDVLYQIAKALQFIHGNGMAHLDVKPDNIYVKDDVYKLGDFGCATKLDGTCSIEDGDSRYIPHEILNDNFDNLDKVDIFSLGVTIYELARGTALPESWRVSSLQREGKLPLFPAYSVQFKKLLEAMIDRNPLKRPSAKQLVESPIFSKVKKSGKAK